MRTGAATPGRRSLGPSRSQATWAIREPCRIEGAPLPQTPQALVGGQSGLHPYEFRPGLRAGPIPLITAGVSAVDLDGQVRADCQVAVRGLDSVLRLKVPPHVVVLGDEALRRLRPTVIGPLLGRPGCASLAVVRACPAQVIAEWARRCPTMEFVSEGHEPRRVAMAFRLVGRLIPVEGAMTVTGKRQKMGEALDALQQAQVFSVKLWAAAIGKSRDWLDRLCATTLDCTPGEVVWAFFDARVRREIRAGRSDAQIAAVVGVADEYVLRRAYSRRGLPFPRP